MIWDLKILRQSIEKLYGQEYLAKLSPSLNSIVERQEFGRLYFYEAKNALKNILDKKTDQKSLLRLVLPFETEERKIFEDRKFIAKAHILSCLQNMHSVPDILSHVIYYSINIKKAKNEKHINIKNVHEWIKEKVKLNSLDAMLDKLITHDDYEYLSALVNHSKHRSIIDSYFNVNLRKHGKDMQEIKFRNFEYDGKEYPSRLVYEFIESEFERESLLIIDIGNEVNRIVKNTNNTSQQTIR